MFCAVPKAATFGSLSFSGLGIGLVFGALQVYLSQHSCKYRGTAHGIMYAGAAASAIVFPYLLEYTTQLFGFRLCLLIFGLLLVNLTVITFLLDKKTWIKGTQQRQDMHAHLLLVNYPPTNFLKVRASEQHP
ncbi:hypothetical protein HPB48_000685 [Haemaphysalis longicornis]|uniref:Monocarboxylate transporter n=1 Tax=Haemaphysalis longicornis TaxID=44386 RepID=A0A9J6GT69_HAELO|nr:hypothetical protein HPB48_000685 [Haemaphysalis longicornis]